MAEKIKEEEKYDQDEYGIEMLGEVATADAAVGMAPPEGIQSAQVANS